jgi:uncharacterized protein YaiI (UPF0178 family)
MFLFAKQEGAVVGFLAMAESKANRWFLSSQQAADIEVSARQHPVSDYVTMDYGKSQQIHEGGYYALSKKGKMQNHTTMRALGISIFIVADATIFSWDGGVLWRGNGTLTV